MAEEVSVSLEELESEFYDPEQGETEVPYEDEVPLDGVENLEHVNDPDLDCDIEDEITNVCEEELNLIVAATEHEAKNNEDVIDNDSTDS